MAVAAANKIVRGDDLTTVAGEIDKYFQRKATGKGLSTNDYTTEEKTKLAGIESGAQKNVKPDWNAASGSAAEILNKPTIPSAVQPATVAPKMDGTAAVGSSAKYAKEDHVHPSDTSKANVNNPQFTGSLTIGGSGNQSVEITNFGELIYAVGSNENSVRLPDNTDLDDVIATQSYVSTAVSNKANKATTLSGYGITNAYTKTEVDTAISNALKGGYVVMANLPTASADTLGKIYLVPMTDTEDSNVKEEYVTWLDGSTYKWEKLGTTQFDNSDYEERLTAAEITTLLNL